MNVINNFLKITNVLCSHCYHVSYSRCVLKINEIRPCIQCGTHALFMVCNQAVEFSAPLYHEVRLRG